MWPRCGPTVAVVVCCRRARRSTWRSVTCAAGWRRRGPELRPGPRGAPLLWACSPAGRHSRPLPPGRVGPGFLPWTWTGKRRAGQVGRSDQFRVGPLAAGPSRRRARAGKGGRAARGAQARCAAVCGDACELDARAFLLIDPLVPACVGRRRGEIPSLRRSPGSNRGRVSAGCPRSRHGAAVDASAPWLPGGRPAQTRHRPAVALRACLR